MDIAEIAKLDIKDLSQTQADRKILEQLRIVSDKTGVKMFKLVSYIIAEWLKTNKF